MNDRNQTGKDLILKPETKLIKVQKKTELSKFTNDQKFEIAKDGLQIGSKLVDLACLYLEGKQRSAERDDEKAMLLLEIEKIDKEAAGYCKMLDADMDKVKEGTERLRIICDFLRSQNCSDEAITSLLLNFTSIP